MHFRNVLTKQEIVDLETIKGMLDNIPTFVSQMDNRKWEKEVEENEIISSI